MADFAVPVEREPGRYTFYKIVHADDLDEAKRIARSRFWVVDGIRDLSREDVTIKTPPAAGGAGGKGK